MRAETNARRQLAVVLGPATAVLGLITAIGLINDVPLKLMVEDPAAIGRLHPLTGLQSSLGILMWCVAAAVCTFTAFALQGGSAAPRA